jgi:hypothetical protein
MKVAEATGETHVYSSETPNGCARSRESGSEKFARLKSKNEQVRVLRINYGAHEKSVMHAHPDGVAIFQNDIHCRFTFPDGETEEHRFRTGETLYLPAGSHLPENMSNQSIDIIFIELKR